MSTSPVVAVEPLDQMVSRARDNERVLIALQTIEDAQRLLLEACQQLSPIQGFAKEWSEVGARVDDVKKTWHQVEARRQGLLNGPPRPKKAK
jgi:hypothetical protein